MHTSSRFAMAVHVLAVLAYHEGNRVTSGSLAGSVNTHPVVIRRLPLTLQRAKLAHTCKSAWFGFLARTVAGTDQLGRDLSGGRSVRTVRHTSPKTQCGVPGGSLHL